MLKTLRFICRHPLGSKRLPSSLARYFRWQLGSRILRHPVVTPFVNQSVLVVERSMTGATGNIYCGLHEFEDMAFCLHALRPSDTFVDVGANIGSYTVLASGVVGAKTIAIEPVPVTYARLLRNVRCNGIEHLVTSLACVAGRTAGAIRFSTDRDTTNQVVDDTYPGSSSQIPVRRLDEILSETNPVLWKVDVEGFEEEVLAGATESLQSPSLNAVLLELDSDVLYAAMTQAGFKRAAYDPFTREITVFEGNASGAHSATAKNNLWVRNIEFLSQRCSSSPKFTVNGVVF